MADRSENPQDNARLDKVARDLGGIADDLSAELNQANELVAQAQADKQRAAEDRSTAKKSAESRATRTPRPGGAAAEGITVDEIHAQSRALEEQVTTEERLKRATQARAKSVADAAEQVKRARADEYLRNVPGGYAGPAAQRPAPGPAAAAAESVQGRVTAAEAVARAQAAEQAKRAQAAVPKPFAPPRITSTQIKAAADSMAALAEREDVALQNALRMVPATRQLNGALQEQTRAIGLSDNAYTRHGYLTSEFISAAARGEVTFAELGTQVTGTIAKFAGWTAAATSVYAVVAAMGALYRGAIQSASGVGLVNRVTTQKLPGGDDALAQNFRNLSRQFNLPTEDVTQAVYGAAKATGGDLPQALQAAEQALFGVKVGELSAADSTRYLQSIMRGFGASASELPAIFDAINQAQNRFGGSTGDMIAGVAKAAGIFKLAGGDYRQLIALITTGTRLTGATGTEVATAISRSASRILTPQGSDALRGVGIDPNQKYGAILAEASRKAQAGTPQQVNAIARALVPQGGQYARILAPILQNRELYNKVFGELDPQKAQGSAQRELAKAFRQPDEQLKRLIIDLERLGSSLASSGGLNLLVGLVFGLDQALNLTVRLVDAFNAFTPGPLRAVLAPLLELTLIMKALRRFDVGSHLPRGADGSLYESFRGGLGRDPNKLNAAQIRRGLRDEETFLGDTRRSTGQRAGLAVYQADRAEERAINARTEYQALPYGAARDEAKGRFDAASRTYDLKQRDMVRLLEDQDDIIARQVILAEQIKEYDRLRATKMSAELAAQKAGIEYAPGTLARPVASRPRKIGEEVSPAGVIIPAGVGTAAKEAEAEALALDSKLSQLAIAGAGASRVGDTLRRTGQVGSNTIKTVGAGIGAGISGLRTLGTTAIAGLDAAFIGIPVAIAVWSKIQSQIKANQATLAQLQDTSGGPSGIEARLQQFEKGNDRSLGATVRHPIHAFGLGIKGLSSDFAAVGNAVIPFGSPLYNTRETEQDAAKQAESFAKNLRAAQKKNALLYIPQVQENFKRALANAQTPGEIDDALNKGISQIDHGYAKTYGGKDAKAVADRVKADLIEQTTALAAARGSLDAAAKHVTDLASLKGFTAGVQTSFGLSGSNAQNLKGAAYGIQFAREAIGKDPTQAAAALQQINSLEAAVTQSVNDRMGRLLAVAKSPGEQAAIRSQAIGDLRTGLTAGLESRAAALGSSIVATEDEITRVQAEIASGRGGAGAQAKLSGLQSRLQSRKNRYGQVTEGLKRENQTVDQFQAEQDRAQFQAEQALFDAQTTRRAGGIRNPVEALRFQLSRQRSRLDDIAKTYGKQSVEYEQALTQEQQLQEQIVQAEVARIQTTAQVRAAQTTNPIVAARITLDGTNRALADLARRGRQQTEQYQQLLIQKAQQQQQLVQAQIQSFQGTQQLNRARANIGASPGAQVQGALTDAQNFAAYVGSLGSAATPDQITGAATAVAQAQGAMADYVRQQAQAMVTAQAELTKSRTTDPVAQARADLTAAQQNVRFAQTPADRVSALAAVNNAKRNVHDVKLQAAEDDIAFQRDMEQISVSAAIARYRGLLRDKELSKAQKQDIARKIKALENDTSGDSSFNIDPNSIRLPTPYEVFRAIKEGANSTQRANLRGAVQNTNHISITVADQSDVQKVADVFDQFLDTSAASSLRAMGVS